MKVIFDNISKECAIKKVKEKHFLIRNSVHQATFNNWMQGKTIPSFYNQMSLAIFLLGDYRLIARSPVMDKLEPGRASEVLSDYFSFIDKHNLLGGYNFVSGSLSIRRRLVSCDEYHNFYLNFLMKLPAYMKLKKQMQDKNLNFDFNVNLIEVFDGELLVGHLAYTISQKKYIPSMNMPERYDGHLFIFPMWYSNSSILKLLINDFLMSDEIVDYCKKRKNIIMMVSNTFLFKFLEEAFDAEINSMVRSDTSSEVMYFAIIDVVKVLSCVDIIKGLGEYMKNFDDYQIQV